MHSAPRKRKAPTLIQTSSGAWYARYRGERVDLPLGLQTPHRSVMLAPPQKSPYRWVTIGKKSYPLHVYERFHSEFSLPYIQGAFDPKRPKESSIKVAEAAEQFLSRKNITANTRASYRGVLRLFVDSLIDPRMNLDQLRVEDVNQFLDRPTLSEASLASYTRQLNAFFNWAIEQEYLNDSGMVTPQKGLVSGRLGRRLFITPSEYKKVRASISQYAERLPEHRKATRDVMWVVDICDLAVSTGLRLAELVHLQWGDVMLDRGILEVRPKTLERDGLSFRPKSKRARYVELQPLAVETLSRPHLLASRENNRSLVFTRCSGQKSELSPVDGKRVSKTWRKHRDLVRTKDPVPFHSLRSAYVTWLLLLSHPQYVVQMWAGHSNPNTTLGYAQWSASLAAPTERARLVEEILDLGFRAP